MNVISQRSIYIFSKFPIDESDIDMCISSIPPTDERYDSEIGNKYLKLFLIPLSQMNIEFIIKFKDQTHSIPIPNGTNFVIYLSKKRIPRIIKPPKTNSLKWLEEFEQKEDFNQKDFDLCYNFILSNNIFTKSFSKNCTTQFQTFLFDYKTLSFYSYDEISNYTFRMINYYQSQLIKNEKIRIFDLFFLHKISTDFYSHFLITPFSSISFLMRKQKIEIEPIRIDASYDESFEKFKELFYHSITTFGLPFIFWIYSSKNHNEIIKEYEKLEGQNGRRRKKNDSSLTSTNYNDIIEIIDLKFKHFESQLNSFEFNMFLTFISKFFNDQFTSELLINSMKNIESEKLEFIKNFNESHSNLNKNSIKKDFSVDDNFASILKEYKGIPHNDNCLKKSQPLNQKISKSDEPMIYKRAKIVYVENKQKQNANQNTGEKAIEKVGNVSANNEDKLYQSSVLQHHDLSFNVDVFENLLNSPKQVKSDEIVIKFRASNNQSNPNQFQMQKRSQDDQSTNNGIGQNNGGFGQKKKPLKMPDLKNLSNSSHFNLAKQNLAKMNSQVAKPPPKSGSNSDSVVIMVKKPPQKNSDQIEVKKPVNCLNASTNSQLTVPKNQIRIEMNKPATGNVTKSDGIVIQKKNKVILDIQLGNKK